MLVHKAKKYTNISNRDVHTLLATEISLTVCEGYWHEAEFIS